jgi:hypothetical protein
MDDYDIFMVGVLVGFAVANLVWIAPRVGWV